jgi:hypothetical protein
MKRILFGTIAVAFAAAMGTVAVPALTTSASAAKAAVAQTVGQVDGNVSSAALSS